MHMKTKNLLYFSISFLFLFFLSNHVEGQSSFYLPHSGNSLKLDEKNDLHLAGSAFEDNNQEETIYSKDFQIAYSPMNNLGIGIHHSQYKIADNNEFGDLHKSKLSGITVGSYILFNFKPYKVVDQEDLSKYKKILLDAYAGFSSGRIENYYLNLGKAGDTNIKFQKYYAQLGAHWIGNFFKYSILAKGGKVHFFDGVLNGPVSDGDGVRYRTIKDNRTFNFLDLSFKIEMGLKGIGVFVETTQEMSIDKPFGNNFLVVNIGGSLNIEEVRDLFSKKKKR